MIDNEFIRVKLDYERKLSNTEKYSDEIGLQECDKMSHLNRSYTPEKMVGKFGMVYCAAPPSQDLILEG
jgi:hypothetical protein